MLSNVAQLAHHNKSAFLALLDAAAGKPGQQVFVGGKALETHGAILVWGAATPTGRQAVIDTYGFSEVITMEEIIRDLCQWQCVPYRDLIAKRRSWANEMFDALLSPGAQGGA